jgi:hypothetical protein
MLIMLAIGLVLLAVLALAVLITAEARQGADLEASMRRFADTAPATARRTYSSSQRAAA